MNGIQVSPSVLKVTSCRGAGAKKRARGRKL